MPVTRHSLYTAKLMPAAILGRDDALPCQAGSLGKMAALHREPVKEYKRPSHMREDLLIKST